MPQIRIDTDQVRQLCRSLSQEASKLSDVQSAISSVAHSVASEISSRRGIHARLNQAVMSINRMENRLNGYERYVTHSASQYDETEAFIISKMQMTTLGANTSSSLSSHTATPFTTDSEVGLLERADAFIKWLFDNKKLSGAYELYNNTIGRVGDFSTAIQYIASSFIMGGLGWSFIQNSGMYQFLMKEGVAVGRFKLPVGSLITAVENSKMNKFARFLISPTQFWRSNVSMSELLFRKFTRLFPSDITNMTNSMQKFVSEVRGASSFEGATGAIKANAGSLAKNALRIGKSNAVLAVVLTGTIETVGAGIKITENYSKYGNNVELLKQENAKVVGQAVYKTAVVSTTTIAGATLFGAAGSVFGPVGTVVGAHVGGFIGSWVGDIIVDKTPGVQKWFEDQAMKHKEAIHSGIEKIADGVQSVKDGFNAVKDQTADLLAGAKNCFGKLGFP